MKDRCKRNIVYGSITYIVLDKTQMV